MIGIDADGSIEAAPAGTIDLTKERELRQLRAQVADLTRQLGEADATLKHSVLSVKSVDEHHGKSACGFHSRVLVSMTEKKVWCSVCGAELEPMDILREFANKERHFIESLHWLRDEKASLRKEIDHLKKERSSLRSQVKAKKKRAADCAPEPPGS